MKPGERVRIIKEASDALRSQEFDVSHLTVREFGYNTTNANGGNWAEILSMDRDNQRLRDIHTYLMGEEAGPAPALADHPWGDNPVKLFISHVHEDAPFVGEVKRLMAERFGIDAFVAHDDIEPSRQWRNVIRTGLSTCDAMIALMHPRFHLSEWCDQEVGWALGRGIPVIPVRSLEFERGVAKDGFLEEHQDFTLRSPRSEWQVARDVLRILLRHEPTHDKAFTAAVEALVNSPGFDHTRWVWPFIEREENITSHHLRRLKYAVESNRQVYDANYDYERIPKLVEALVKKHEMQDPWLDLDEPPF